MLVEVAATDSNSKIGPTGFTVYLWFVSMILLAASFGTVLETNGAFSVTITEQCNGLGQCTAVRNSNDFPCPEYKSVFEALLPLNIVAFILAFFVTLAHLGIWSDSDDAYPDDSLDTVASCSNYVGFLIMICVGCEAALSLYVHLGQICVFPGREQEGKISIRHGLPDMELGPTFTLLAIGFIFQFVANVWTNRRWLRRKCSCAFGWAAERNKKLERARLAEKYKLEREKEEEKSRKKEEKKKKKKQERASSSSDHNNDDNKKKKKKKYHHDHQKRSHSHHSNTNNKTSADTASLLGGDFDDFSMSGGGGGISNTKKQTPAPIVIAANPLSPSSSSSPSQSRGASSSSPRLRAAANAMRTAGHLRDNAGAPKSRSLGPSIDGLDDDDFFGGGGGGAPSYMSPAASGMMTDVSHLNKDMNAPPGKYPEAPAMLSAASSPSGTYEGKKPPAFAILERKMSKKNA